jgi:isopentenyl phosphate kinase
MIVAVKLGGSVITDKSKPYTLREAELKRLVKEIKAALDEDKELKLIVGNGGGSFPHQPAKKGELKDGIKDSWQLPYVVQTHKAAAALNALLRELLVQEGVLAFTIAPSSAALAKNGKILSMETGALKKLVYMGIVPLVYGDVIMDTEKGCIIASTEQILDAVARDVKIDRMIIGTNTDGVLDAEGKTIPEINSQNIETALKDIRGASTTDVTGGMRHKVEAMLELSKKIPEVRIVNAMTPGEVKEAMLGAEKGTRIRYKTSE